MLYVVGEGLHNPPPSDRFNTYYQGFRDTYPTYDLTQPRIVNAVEMLAKAINAANSASDVVAVGKALEGMEHDSILGTKVFMRPSDHQAIQNVHIAVHTDEDIKWDMDRSGYGLKVFKTVEMASKDSPTTCKMKRP